MTEEWLNQLDYDPLDVLINSTNPSIQYLSRRDFLKEKVGPIDTIWDLPEPGKILRRQQGDGSWKYPGANKKLRSQENYNQLETFRQLGELIEKYEFNKNHKVVQKAADYFFSCQTDEGDFRGIYGSQYATTYHSAIMELLIKAGYVKDPRIEKGFQWLLSQRQNDGGWTIPFRTLKIKYSDALKLSSPLQSDPMKPFSHLITGMVIRAFAVHPHYSQSKEAHHAGKLLMSRFFLRDKYPDRQDKKYWESVSFPFWFTNIVTALDSLYYLGFKKEEAPINNALQWLVKQQNEEGVFDLKLLMIRDKDLKYWVTLAICRILKGYYG
ncbi:prenyltransferase/squalene oxidase repeat-containing protein [Methanobacterium alcaliphilum]|uniref:prenyltransferase/squalene oxidase repeat-containing protein n=1 Tax=Methanobacterium alcaliphilum TaxID=392018 RepID=UPI00200A0A8D|nr:prenyltransferase/squalene oxidase repeat-containing protein [Methanobacterium alcaliphilum]MCK9152563.1 hypothetical protein [Methanobacterium alcaliphilum]